jgi:hypothetical protein
MEEPLLCVSTHARSTHKLSFVAQERRFWRGTKKIPYVGHAGTCNCAPFLIQDERSVVVATTADSDAASVINGTRVILLRGSVMCAHRVSPTDSLTWDDVCQLWDNGFYTVEDIKSIATLYFDGTELPAVLDVIEDVENESQMLGATNTALGDYDEQPAAISVPLGISDCTGFESVPTFLEPDRDNPWHGLH